VLPLAGFLGGVLASGPGADEDDGPPFASFCLSRVILMPAAVLVGRPRSIRSLSLSILLTSSCWKMAKKTAWSAAVNVTAFDMMKLLGLFEGLV